MIMLPVEKSSKGFNKIVITAYYIQQLQQNVAK
jgi:hypothetical protein